MGCRAGITHLQRSNLLCPHLSLNLIKYSGTFSGEHAQVVVQAPVLSSEILHASHPLLTILLFHFFRYMEKF